MNRQPVGRPTTVVIIPCGKRKVWRREPGRGPTPARDAYTGTPFCLARRFAERFGDLYLVLSAKHGLLQPEDAVPEDYDVTFTRPETNPVGPELISAQLASLLPHGRVHKVVALGGREYLEAISAACAPLGLEPAFPFAGLPVGKTLRAIKRALDHTPAAPRLRV